MRLLPPQGTGHADVRKEIGLRVDIQNRGEIAVELGVVVAVGGHVPHVADRPAPKPVRIQMDAGLGDLAVIVQMEAADAP